MEVELNDQNIRVRLKECLRYWLVIRLMHFDIYNYDSNYILTYTFIEY